MRSSRVDTVEINFHVSNELFAKIHRLQESGLSLSAMARLAIRKCAKLPLEDQECPGALPKRLLLYLHADDARLLDELAAKEGERSRARTLRKLIHTYLLVNAEAIEALF
jgi:hypothetical protein